MSMKKTDLEKQKGRRLVSGHGRSSDRWGKGSSGGSEDQQHKAGEPLAVRLLRLRQKPKTK